ncbi:hypothetical protein HanIR_Chr14g0687571 [Helianthus annuus]|nr:hypothetical protein HanIR_Chr14g0687571 [Helianthus annuus]
MRFDPKARRCGIAPLATSDSLAPYSAPTPSPGRQGGGAPSMLRHCSNER